MFLKLKVPLFILNILNVFLHTAGIALLLSASKTNVRNRLGECKQHIFLLNLSIAEVLFNFIKAVRVILFYIDQESQVIETVRHYLLIVNFTAIWIQVCVALFGMTIDRLMNITLELKYPIYWNKSKSKNCLLIGWCVSACIGISISLAYLFFKFPWEEVFFLYVYPTIDASFILLAIVTYVLIFRKYKESQKFRELSMSMQSDAEEPLQNDTSNKKGKCSFLIFIKTRFYVPIMLVLTFLIFIVIPDLVYLTLGLHANLEHRNLILAGCWISYAVENFCDVIIYVFLQPNIRKHLTETMQMWYPCLNDHVT